jgi:hypothetical protein
MTADQRSRLHAKEIAGGQNLRDLRRESKS